MNRLLLSLVTVLSLFVAGCDVCNRVASATENANAKGKECGQSSSSTWDVQICQDNLSSCSEEDQKNLDAYADCLNELPVCKAGQETSFTFGRLGCTQPMARVSFSCLASVQ